MRFPYLSRCVQRLIHIQSIRITPYVVGVATIDCANHSKPRAKPRGKAPADLHSCRTQLLENNCLCDKRNCWSSLQGNLIDAARLMMDMRIELQGVKRQDQSRVLFDLLLPMRRVKSSAGGKPFFIDFNVYGVPVCADVWCEFLGFSYTDSRMKRLLASLRRGDAEWQGNNICDPMTGRRGVWAEAWMRAFVIETADWEPNKNNALLDPNPTEVCAWCVYWLGKLWNHMITFVVRRFITCCIQQSGKTVSGTVQRPA